MEMMVRGRSRTCPVIAKLKPVRVVAIRWHNDVPPFFWLSSENRKRVFWSLCTTYYNDFYQNFCTPRFCTLRQPFWLQRVNAYDAIAVSKAARVSSLHASQVQFRPRRDPPDPWSHRTPLRCHWRRAVAGSWSNDFNFWYEKIFRGAPVRPVMPLIGRWCLRIEIGWHLTYDLIQELKKENKYNYNYNITMIPKLFIKVFLSKPAILTFLTFWAHVNTSDRSFKQFWESLASAAPVAPAAQLSGLGPKKGPKRLQPRSFSGTIRARDMWFFTNRSAVLENGVKRIFEAIGFSAICSRQPSNLLMCFFGTGGIGIRSQRQKLARSVFVLIWGPGNMVIFSRKFIEKNGLKDITD